MARFIDKFEVLLLDMGNTFMFGCDRFDEDLAATYASLGGQLTAPRQVRLFLGSLFESMLGLARGLEHDSFPRVHEQLAQLPVTSGLPIAERNLLSRTFALHEVGTIPPPHADTLRRLRETHRLGLISNVWSDSDVFVDELRRAGVDTLFETMVFSSDHGSIKPSPRLFDVAFRSMLCDRARTVYIGDKLHRDVAGAKAAGIASVWVNLAGNTRPDSAPRPDLEIGCISELLTV